MGHKKTRGITLRLGFVHILVLWLQYGPSASPCWLSKVLLNNTCTYTKYDIYIQIMTPYLHKPSISPAYDPNSKDTWNSHVFCVGTHWKSENAHQCSSPKHHKPWPKHHRSITTRHWDTKASPTQSRDITNTKPRHHPHITKTSQHNHYTSPRHAQDITNTSLKDHQNITSTCRKHLDAPPTNHWNISEISPNHPWNTNKT